MGSFSEFLKNDHIKEDKNFSTNKEQEISQLIDKYSTYNHDELMDEFLKETEKKKENGEIDDEKLSKVKNLLTPYLSQEQMERLNDLIDMVK